MTDPAHRPNTVPWPPLILVACLVIAYGLGLVLPLPLRVLPAGLQRAAGALVAFCGVALDVWAMTSLSAGRTTVLPHRASSHLVVDGPYRFSRNPIYLGNTVVVVGIGVGLGSLWYLLAAVAAAGAAQKLAIEPEERHLAALFGTEFEDYCGRVRRWL